MKNTFYNSYRIVIGFSVFLLITSCDQTIIGTGAVVDVKKNTDKFSKVDLQMEANVTLTQTTENSIVVHAQQNIADAIEVSVTGKTLKIYSNKYLSPTEIINIEISMTNIEGLEISGSGEIKSAETIKTPEINLGVSGSGKITLDLVSNKIESEITGSGVMNLKGSALEINNHTSGSGHLNAFDLLVKNATIEISGSGDARVTASLELKAKVSGSGNVLYKGTPTKIDQKVSGSGTIKPE